MSAQHTPGPWENVAGEIWAGGKRIKPSGGAYGEKDRAVNQANARLIAAAPELLRLLTNLTDLAQFRGGHLDEYGAAIREARAAINNAKGG